MNINKKMVLMSNDVGHNFSKDTSTKIGAIITEENYNILTHGYNGMPRGLNDHAKERNDREYTIGGRPIKYSWAEHGERNAIYNIGRNFDLFNNKVLLVNTELDIEEIRSAISSGIKKLIVISSNKDGEISKNKYIEEIGKEMLEESTMKYVFLNYSDPETLLEKLNEEKLHAESFGGEGILARKGFNITNEKLIKKIKLLNIHASYFSEDHTLTSPDGKPHVVSNGAAVIFDETDNNDLAISGTGFNAVVLNNTKSKNMKSEYTLGAVRNVIYSAISSYLKDKLIFVNLCPCIDCAKAIASVGISKAYFMNNVNVDPELMKRWEMSFKSSQEYLVSAGVDLNKIDVSL